VPSAVVLVRVRLEVAATQPASRKQRTRAISAVCMVTSHKGLTEYMEPYIPVNENYGVLRFTPSINESSIDLD
jgi:hypothetical protein